MDALADISMVIYIMVGVFLVIILGIAIKRYLDSRKTPGERTAFFFLIMSISSIVFFVIYFFGLFTIPDTLPYIVQRKLFFLILVTIPFLSVLFAVQTQYGNLLDKGRYFTIAGIITYLMSVVVGVAFDTSALWAHLLYYGIAVACITPSIYLWINLISLSRTDPAMDSLKFGFYLIGFSLLDAFYLHNFLVGVVYGDARESSQVFTDFIDAIILLGMGIFIVMAQLRSSRPSS
jgi:hypothetical protein